MLTGIDHVLVACADPDQAATDVEAAVGLRASAGGRHLAHGTFNRLIWLGDSYIELMGVFDDSLAANSWWGRYALTVLERGGGFMGVVLASDDVAVDAALLRVVGSVLGEPEAGSRTRPDGKVVRWTIAREPSPDLDLGLLFLIEHDTDGRRMDARRTRRPSHDLSSAGRTSAPRARGRARRQHTARDHASSPRPGRRLPSLAGRCRRARRCGRPADSAPLSGGTKRPAAGGRPRRARREEKSTYWVCAGRWSQLASSAAFADQVVSSPQRRTTS